MLCAMPTGPRPMPHPCGHDHWRRPPGVNRSATHAIHVSERNTRSEMGWGSAARPRRDHEQARQVAAFQPGAATAPARGARSSRSSPRARAGTPRPALRPSLRPMRRSAPSAVQGAFGGLHASGLRTIPGLPDRTVARTRGTAFRLARAADSRNPDKSPRRAPTKRAAMMPWRFPRS